MKKRIRKKRRLGEFREDCFELTFAVAPNLSDVAREEFYDDFIEMIESNDLLCGGGCNDVYDLVIEASGRGSATEEHRQIIKAWLAARKVVSGIVVGDLQDAWHGWQD